MNTYKNGNYLVTVNPEETGTKIYQALRTNEDFDPEFPDNIDIKLTGRCYQGCPYCHESSNSKGTHANLRDLQDLIERSLPKGIPIELSFGGGNVALIEPDQLEIFFKWIKSKGYISSITLNHTQIIESYLQNWDLKVWPHIQSVGISLDNEFMKDIPGNMTANNPLPKVLYAVFNNVKNPPHIVYHLVLGTFNLSALEDFFSKYPEDLPSKKRILFLGYKTKGRGEDWFKNIPEDWMKEFRRWLVQGINGVNPKWKGKDWNISFDNLAITQLNLKDSILSKSWDKLYMGQENSHSIYIDAVTKTFAKSSTSLIRESWGKYGDSIITYFQSVKQPHNNV